MPNPAEPRFPTHVAIIVDGNRRWAKQRMLPVSVGHKAGFDRLREITRYAVGDRGVFVLSLYVFSTENFSRDAKEVGYLMDLFANNFRTIADEMNERGCKVLFSGRREGLQQRVLDAMDYMMDLTKDNEKGIVNFCLNYGSHAELTDATRAIAAEVKRRRYKERTSKHRPKHKASATESVCRCIPTWCVGVGVEVVWVF